MCGSDPFAFPPPSPVERLAVYILGLERSGMGWNNVERAYRELPPDDRAALLARARRELTPDSEVV